uniref:S-methyl-5-thioribose-1-phosphate isomerase n=1 Tax=Branchiostoma floridae TaxID=7739 RepID=C3ZLI3_BRAFL|eukprot:XP_002590609.1 hypothetical protein BRAFLDRAFT_83750 [Branchiostoma floridae]
MSLQAIRYKRGELQLLNQLLLPDRTEYEDIKTVEDGWRAIKEMKAIQDMLDKDVEDNKTMGRYGAEHILQNVGVIRALNEKKAIEEVYCTETRPYNQGARLQLYELVHDNIPATLITDSMAAALMRTKGISAVVVGADRVVANGDTANKIGTYQLAILAHHHGVPFYIAAPSTTCDLSLRTGEEIVIEERSQKEMTHIGGTRLAPEVRYMLNRAMLVARDPSEALDIITNKKGPGVASGFSVNIGYASDFSKLYNIEVAPTVPNLPQYSQTVLDVQGQEHYFHFNMYDKLNGTVPQYEDPSTEHRKARAAQMASPYDLKNIVDILGDTQDPDYPIYRTPNNKDGAETVATALFC